MGKGRVPQQLPRLTKWNPVVGDRLTNGVNLQLDFLQWTYSKEIHHRKHYDEVQVLPQWLAMRHVGVSTLTWQVSLEASSLFLFFNLFSKFTTFQYVPRRALFRRPSHVFVKPLNLRNFGFLFCEMGGNVDREQKWRYMTWCFICHLDGIQNHPEVRPMGVLVTENGKDHSIGWGPELSVKEERSWAFIHLSFLSVAATWTTASGSCCLDFLSP